MSKSLFDLIKTLSKAEKRVFSENLKRTKRKPYYLKLVASYSKAKTYSTEIDLRIFKSERPKFISDCKIKCRDLLYDYLVTMEKNKGIKRQVEQKIKIAQMLMNRKQYEEAQKLLKKIEVEATKFELLEELINIKIQKIRAALLIGGDNAAIDLNKLRMLTQEKSRVIQHFVDFHNTKNDAQITVVDYHLKMGLQKNIEAENKLVEDQVKKLGVTLNLHQKRLFEHLGEENFEFAIDELEHILTVIEQHIDIVLEAKLLILGLVFYFLLYVELCTIFHRKFDINQLFKQIDCIPYHSVKEEWEILNFKMVIGSLYALSINTPRIALPWVEEAEQFFKSNEYIKRDNTGNILYRLFLSLAIGEWEDCLLHIDKIESNVTSEYTSASLLNLKLICIYEQKNFYYFDSLINKHLSKKRKRGITANTIENINDSIFYFLYSIAKGNNNIERHFKRILKNFDPLDWKFRYIIHWICCQFPDLLHGNDYASFLEQHTYQHYDFKVLKYKTEIPVLVNEGGFRSTI